jgi:AraC family transcriptional regulator, regulatory protein of adaptative response / DNA-3-methyladenine glycosylase II
MPVADVLRFELSFRPPYDWPAMKAFLGARVIVGVEMLDGSCYRRTVRVTAEGRDHLGWVEIGLSPKKPALHVAVSSSLARALPPLLARIKALMDLSCHPTEVAGVLGELAQRRPGIRVPGAFDGFEIAVRAIIGQQVTIAAARTIAGRFAAALGDPIETPFEALTTIFPSAARVAGVAVDLIAHLGMPAARARTVIALACAVADGYLILLRSQKYRPHSGVGRRIAPEQVGAQSPSTAGSPVPPEFRPFATAVELCRSVSCSSRPAHQG